MTKPLRILEQNGILPIDRWETPATSYPLSKSGKAEIKRKNYSKGVYHLHGADEKGFSYFQVMKPIPVTSLEIDGKTWMVDDPTHWLYIQRMARKMKGNVLIGGLGLGLIVHALALNTEIDSVTVVEMNQDVIQLVSPLVPHLVNHGWLNREIKFVEAEIAAYCLGTSKQFDDAFIDIWVTNSAEETMQTLFHEVIPLANLVEKTTGASMYALGFSGAEKILDKWRFEGG